MAGSGENTHTQKKYATHLDYVSSHGFVAHKLLEAQQVNPLLFQCMMEDVDSDQLSPLGTPVHVDQEELMRVVWQLNMQKHLKTKAKKQHSMQQQNNAALLNKTNQPNPIATTGGAALLLVAEVKEKGKENHRRRSDPLVSPLVALNGPLNQSVVVIEEEEASPPPPPPTATTSQTERSETGAPPVEESSKSPSPLRKSIRERKTVDRTALGVSSRAYNLKHKGANVPKSSSNGSGTNHSDDGGGRENDQMVRQVVKQILDQLIQSLSPFSSSSLPTTLHHCAFTPKQYFKHSSAAMPSWTPVDQYKQHRNGFYPNLSYSMDLEHSSSKPASWDDCLEAGASSCQCYCNGPFVHALEDRDHYQYMWKSIVWPNLKNYDCWEIKGGSTDPVTGKRTGYLYQRDRAHLILDEHNPWYHTQQSIMEKDFSITSRTIVGVFENIKDDRMLARIGVHRRQLNDYRKSYKKVKTTTAVDADCCCILLTSFLLFFFFE
jgi:hypothetical protein